MSLWSPLNELFSKTVICLSLRLVCLITLVLVLIQRSLLSYTQIVLEMYSLNQFFIHSRSISLLSWCLSQWLVGDSGHPDIVFHQFRQTKDSRVNARRSEMLDLPGLCWRRSSSSSSQSLEYNIKNVRISTASTISNGRSISFCRKQTGKYNLTFRLMLPGARCKYKIGLVNT